jgi:GAF domain-containing protein
MTPQSPIFFLVPFLLSLSFIGALIVWRQPKNLFGWIFIFVTLLINFNLAGAMYGQFAAVKEHGAWPAGVDIAWLAGGWNWIAISAILLIFIPLLYPTGRLLSPRWRFVIWCAVAFTVLAGIPNALMPGPLFENPNIRNPIGLEGYADLLDKIRNISLVPAGIGIIGAVASLVVRFRRAKGQERQQLKWFLYGCSLFLLPLLLHGSPVPDHIQQLLIVLLWPALPISIAIAMLKYRLYDVDLVISKSLVFGALAVFITAVYVGIVVGIGALIGSAGRPNLALSIVATAIVAVAFQPVRERVERIANRLVYGQRPTPYEVMANLAERMAGANSIDDVLPQMAQVVGRGVGARVARTRLLLPDGTDRSAGWPIATQAERFDRVLPVSYGGALLGEIAVARAAAEPLTPAEDKLLDDLAAQAGLVLHNVRLTMELEERLAEISSQASQLRASRQRIVAAQSEERRRLEETIRHGSEQQLIRIRSELESTVATLARTPDAAVRTLERLTEQTTAVLEELRELARGLYPPVLEERGLAAALQIQLRKTNPSVTIEAEGSSRYPSEVETAIYYCCLEALHGSSGPARIQLSGRDHAAEFSIRAGQSLVARLERIEDRVEALGGSVRLDGDTLRGVIPLEAARQPVMVEA